MAQSSARDTIGSPDSPEGDLAAVPAGAAAAAGNGAAPAVERADGAAPAEVRADGITPDGEQPDTGQPDAARSGPAPDEAPPAARWAGSRWLSGGTVAVLTWLIATPVAFVLPKLIGKDPFSPAGTTVPVVAACCLAIAVFLVAVRRRGDAIAGLAGGLAAAWVVLMLRAALVGTPFGFGGMASDMGRTAASATRYTTTIASSDTFLPSLPSEYPPLFTWLVGRVSVLIDVPAWRLLGDAEIMFVSISVLVGFLLWRRLVGPWVAVAISTLTLITWADPRKAYEMVTLVIVVPWALETFARPPRRRMHWLPAGLIGGFIVLMYQAWLVYAAFGFVALMIVAWRTEPDRWRYLRRIGLIVLVAFVVSSWYVIPFVWASLTIGGTQVSDLYASTSVNEKLFPFLNPTPIGLLSLIGLVGLVWLWKSVWWARPLLTIIIGVYAYRLVAMVRFALTGHTAFLHYTARLYAVMFTIAGVLVVAHVTPILLRRLRVAPPRLAAAAALAVVLAWAGSTFTTSWMPPASEYALAAHMEPLPGGGYSPYAPSTGRRAWFPATQVRQAVEGVLGAGARPVTLTVDDRIFSYVPWDGYVDADRTASATLAHWDKRMAEIRKLVATTDPAAFADRSGHTAFGPIDVFVLKRTGAGWDWQDERFSPSQFSPRYWTVVDGLPEDIVVAIRR